MSWSSLSAESPKEIVRAALCALAYKSPREALPVHIHRITYLASKFGLTEDAAAFLKSKLTLMRECQDIGNGFWFPTPPRLVPLQETNLVIAPNSTKELQLVFGRAVQVAGLGRTSDYSLDLPTEPLESWCRAPSDIRLWTKDVLNQLERKLQPAMSPEGRVEVYCAWRHVSYLNNNLLKRRWQGIQTIQVPTGLVVLCRRYSLGRWSHFVAKMQGSKIHLETPISPGVDISRLIHGLDALKGNTYQIGYIQQDDNIHFSLPTRIPKEEYRLVMALSTWSQDSQQRHRLRCSTQSRYFYDIRASLEKLGYVWRRM